MNSLVHLTDAVFIQNDQIKTDSQKVAKVFGKLHKNVLRAIENLKAECDPDFYQLNFEPVIIEYSNGKGGIQQAPAYNLTKDGFTLLVMGFIGKQAFQFKVDYIKAFNQMATLLHNQQLHGNPLQVGSLVQLKSGSQQLTLTRLIHDAQGSLQQAEVIWFHRNKLHQHILPISALVACQSNQLMELENPVLRQFWSALFAYGIGQINHSNRSDTIALNLPQVYQLVGNLPPRTDLNANLTSSASPFPTYERHNVSFRSHLDAKAYKCWIFQRVLTTRVIEHGGQAQ